MYSKATPTTGNINVLINLMPSLTATGKSYTFVTVDPSTLLPSSYFDSFFPFLKDDLPPILTLDTSLWFTSPSTTGLVYALNASDGTRAPDWLLFDSVSGQLTVHPEYPHPSELVQLKFAVTDQNQGWCQVYKSVLLNTVPRVKKSLYKVLNLAVMRDFSYDVGSLFTDENGDYLEVSFSKSADETEVNKYGIHLVRQVLTGNPLYTGTIGLVTVRATDVHGAYAEAYITIKITDYRVNRRKVTYPDVTVYEGRRFAIALKDNLFYDTTDSSPLVFYISDQAD